jgi:hypothetical protein
MLLVQSVRDQPGRSKPAGTSEFTTIRLRLIKIAARVVEHGWRLTEHLPARAREVSTSAPSRSGCCPPDHDRRGMRPDEPPRWAHQPPTRSRRGKPGPLLADDDVSAYTTGRRPPGVMHDTG